MSLLWRLHNTGVHVCSGLKLPWTMDPRPGCNLERLPSCTFCLIRVNISRSLLFSYPYITATSSDQTRIWLNLYLSNLILSKNPYHSSLFKIQTRSFSIVSFQLRSNHFNSVPALMRDNFAGDNFSKLLAYYLGYYLSLGAPFLLLVQEAECFSWWPWLANTNYEKTSTRTNQVSRSLLSR